MEWPGVSAPSLSASVDMSTVPDHASGAPFSDEKLAAISDVVQGVIEKTLAEHRPASDGSSSSKGTDSPGTSSSELSGIIRGRGRQQ